MICISSSLSLSLSDISGYCKIYAYKLQLYFVGMYVHKTFDDRYSFLLFLSYEIVVQQEVAINGWDNILWEM